MRSKPAHDQSTEVVKKSWPDDDKRAWIELTYQAGMANVKAQSDELSGMRQRSITYSAFIISASGFLVGTGLNKMSQDPTFAVLAIGGTLGFAALAVSLILLVAPFLRFQFVLDPDALMRWMEGDQRAPSRTIALRGLTEATLPKMIRKNRASLKVARRLYRTVLITGAVTVGCWIWAIGIAA